MKGNGIHRGGHGISWGSNTKHASISSRGLLGSSVRGNRKSSQTETVRPRDVSLLFFQTFPRGDLFFFWPQPTLCLLSFYFFLSSNAPFFLPVLLSRSDICGPEYICLATAAPNFPSAKNKCFASGVGRQREWGEKGAHSGLGALVVEWIWQTLRDDTGLDSPRLASLATIHLRPFVYTSLSFVHPKTVWLLVWTPGLTVMEDFFHQTVQTMHQCSKKLQGTWDQESLVYSNKTHLRKSYYTVEYDNSYTLLLERWTGAGGALSNVSINLQNEREQRAAGEKQGQKGVSAACVCVFRSVRVFQLTGVYLQKMF